MEEAKEKKFKKNYVKNSSKFGTKGSKPFDWVVTGDGAEEVTLSPGLIGEKGPARRRMRGKRGGCRKRHGKKKD